MLRECQKLNVMISGSEDFSHLKYLLQKALIEEVLKIDCLDNRDEYLGLLSVTKSFLNLKDQKISGYSCSIVGCLFRRPRHADYISHLKNVHPHLSSFCCMFKNTCRRNFQSLETLEDHLLTEHCNQNLSVRIPTTLASSIIGEECQCRMISCGQKHFSTAKDLMSHINRDHRTEYRHCIFDGCHTFFNAGKESRQHFYLKHLKVNNMKLKSQHLIGYQPSLDEVFFLCDGPIGADESSGCDDTLMDLTDNQNGMSIDYNSDGDNQHADTESEDLIFMMAYADFLNRLTSFQFLPLSTVKIIASEYLTLSRKSSSQRETLLRASLQETGKLSSAEIEALLSTVSESDLFMKAQEELLSGHKRSDFLNDHFTVIKTVEIILNPDDVKKGA